jgi:nicotinate dehydrogenase subunit B
MTAMPVSRRNVLKGSGGLFVSFLLPESALSQPGRLPSPLNRRLSPSQLDTYLSIDTNGVITAFFGKTDMGQGVDVAVAQIVAEELDAALDQVQIIMGDSALCVNQGGASGSTAIESGARPLRNAAAEARQVLLELASEALQVDSSTLEITDGQVHVTGDSSHRVGFGDLIGNRHFDVTLDWNGAIGNGLNVTGQASPKSPEQYKLVGQSAPRRELPAIIFGTQEYVVDVKLPGMLHGRIIRPEVAGAVPLSTDAGSIADIPGVQVIHVGDFLGVVAEKEWHAIKAARQLSVQWSQVSGPFPDSNDIYDHIRNEPVARESGGSGFGPDVPVDREKLDQQMAQADTVIEAEYEFPFQSHASMGPACAVCDVRNGQATLWTGSQKPHDAQVGIAALLDIPVEDVRSIWVLGPGTYGRNDAGDAAIEAALMSRETGRPVRVQGMRHEGSGWDPKAPASIHRVRAGLDADGNIIAYEFMSKGYSAGDMAAWERSPSDTYAGMLTGWPNATVHRFGNPGDRYEFPEKLQYWQTVPPLLEKASPLRTAHFRDPLGPQIHFASESFIDELAVATGKDPIELRLEYLQDPRDRGVLEAVRERTSWQPRVPGPEIADAGTMVTGSGVAYTRRGNSVVAVVAEVEVNRATGRVWPRKFTVAADQGKIVNPLWLRRTLEGNIVMATSRTLWEEVAFDNNNVTSVDWVTYPILEMEDAPEEIDIVLIDHDDLPPYGAGEPSTRPVTAAIANAIYDATGLRIRTAPFTPERIRTLIERGLAADMENASDQSV